MRKLLLGFIAGFRTIILSSNRAAASAHGAWCARGVGMRRCRIRRSGRISLSLGGVWGAIMIRSSIASAVRRTGIWRSFSARLRRPGRVFVLAPLKHQPIAAGWKPGAMLIGPIVNGCGTRYCAVLSVVF